jgi:hypothetical protein
VLRRIFRPKRDEVIGDWRKLHTEELLYHLHSSGNIIRMMKSRRMRWAGHVTRSRKKRNACRTSVEKSERNQQGDLDVGRRIILPQILDKMVWYGLD